MIALSDLRIALRSVLRSPGFAALATGILVTGIGLTLYMFGALNGFILRPLPYPGADRLIHVELAADASGRSAALELPDFVALRDRVTGSRDLTAFYEGTLNLADHGSGEQQAERLDGLFVTGGFFAALGQQPFLGRAIQPGDGAPGAPQAVVLSAGVWERRYAGDPGVIGRATRVNGQPATIVGVMPPDFRFPQRTEAWAALPEVVDRSPGSDPVLVEVVGHLEPGVSIPALRAELDTLLAAIAAARPEGRQNPKAVVKPLAEEWVGRGTRQQIGIMFVAVVLVLFIACANVANLLYLRGLARQRQVALRAALGASRRHLVTLGLAEAAAIALLASAVALPLSQAAGDWTMEALRANEDMDIPSWVSFRIDGLAVAFTLGIATLTALAAGLGPALAGARTDPQRTLRGTGRGVAPRHRRASRALVIAQIALSFGLVTCATLAARSLTKLYSRTVGVDGARILGGRLALYPESFPDDAARLAFLDRVEAGLAALPGVSAATVTTSLPATFRAVARVEAEGASPAMAAAGPSSEGHDALLTGTAAIAPSFFPTMGVPLLAGREFGIADDAGSQPVAVVNQTLASSLFGTPDVLGRRLRLVRGGQPGPWLTIVGVAPDLHHSDIDDPSAPMVYRPLRQEVPRFAFVALRSATADASSFAVDLRRVVASVDRDQPVYFLRTVDEWIAIVRWSNRFLGGLFGAFALAGLALAAVGVYGVAAYSVTQRTAEIGVRRALGAQNSAVSRLVAGRAVNDLAWGILLGLGLAVLLGRQVASFFYGVDAFDVPTLVAVPSVLVVATALATWSPVRRALRVEPARALREE